MLRALRFEWATPLYDPIARRLLRGAALEEAILTALGPCRGLRALEVACGPGRLARALADRGADVIAIDGDPDMIAQARARGVDARLARAEALPLETGTFDVAVTSLALHHLDRAPRALALGEIRRALRPGGVAVIADWGPPRALGAPGFALVRALDGIARTGDHARGALPSQIAAAGFEVTRSSRVETVLGTIDVWRAT